MTQMTESTYDDICWLGDNPEDYDDLLEYEDEPIKCNACFGTGIDRYEDADCLNCYGDGYV